MPEYKRGHVMWNKLHNNLKNSTNVNIMFKKRYKTFLVSEYAETPFIPEIAISNLITTFVV